MKNHFHLSLITLVTLLSISFNSFAADFNGSELSLLWGIPFIGILLSIALLPLLLPRLWHYHYGKIIIFWTLLFLISMLLSFGWQITITLTSKYILEEYIHFIIVSKKKF